MPIVSGLEMQIIARLTSSLNDTETDIFQEIDKYETLEGILLNTDRLKVNNSSLQEVCVSPTVMACLEGSDRTIILYNFHWNNSLCITLLQKTSNTFILKMDDNDDDDFIEVSIINVHNSELVQSTRVNDDHDLHTFIDEWCNSGEKMQVIRMDVVSSNNIRTLNVINIVDDESMESLTTLLDEIQFMNTPLGEIVNIKKETTTVIVEVSDDKHKVYRSIQLVKKLLRLKDDVNLLEAPQNVDDNIFKLKYDSALKKIIELEAKLETLQLQNDVKNTTDLTSENFELKHQIALYEEILQNDIKRFDKSVLREVEQRVIQKLGFANSDAHVFKKLLVTKTDKLLQLEYEIKELNRRHLNLKKQNSSESIKKGNTDNHTLNETEKALLLAMTETIQRQQVHLRKELDKAEAELKRKEKLLEETNKKWIQRNETVTKEQNEVEKKLVSMENRFKNIAAIADNASKQYPVTTSTTPQTPIRPNSERDERESETRRKGLNLNIIQPF